MIGTVVAVVAGLAVGCGSDTAATTTTPGETTAAPAAPAAECVQAFQDYADALVDDPLVAEGPLQKATIRECSRTDWLAVAQDYTDSVVLADPEKVLEAFCGGRQGKACTG